MAQRTTTYHFQKDSPVDSSVNVPLYGHLNDRRREIRILKLLSLPQINKTLQCEMTTVSLEDVPKYIALSYVWGDVGDTTEIAVDGKIRHVTSNLASALESIQRRLYSDEETEEGPLNLPSFLWADALCINQSDDVEKTNQVQMMGDIYRKAALVISWLGRGDEQTALALHTFKFLDREIEERTRPVAGKDLGWLQQFPELWEENVTEQAIPNKAWNAIRSLLRLPYWPRIWIIQEMVLARRILLMDQLTSVDFDCLRVTVRLINMTVKNEVFQKPAFFPFLVWTGIRSSMSWFKVLTIHILRFGQRNIDFDLGTASKKLLFDGSVYHATY
jgi:hypothetical protein